MKRGPVPDPSPDEIAERAALIREDWTLAEHYRRSGRLPPWWLVESYRVGTGVEWQPPVVACRAAVLAGPDAPW